MLGLQHKIVSSLSSFRKNVHPQFNQCAQQHGPQRDADKRQLQIGQFLQFGAQRQAEAQFEQHGGQVPGAQTQVWRAVARVIPRFAMPRHLDGEHEDEDAIKDPDWKEDEEPVPLHLGRGRGVYY